MKRNSFRAQCEKSFFLTTLTKKSGPKICILEEKVDMPKKSPVERFFSFHTTYEKTNFQNIQIQSPFHSKYNTVKSLV